MAPINLDQLRVFLAVARHLHFSRAAEELYITQPAVSACVAKLENHYGVRLFHRIGRRVALTDAGRFLAHEGPRLLEGVEQLERGLHDFSGLRRGALSLGASFTVGNYWLPDHLKVFGERHGGIEVRCRLGNAEQVLEGTSQGQFDLCFLTGWVDGGEPPQLDGQLTAEQVGVERLRLVVGRGHGWYGRERIEAHQLRQGPWVLREAGSGAQRLFESELADLGVDAAELQVALVLNSSEMVKAVVIAGGGVAALPESMLHQDLALGLLWAPEIGGRQSRRQPIWMVRHPKRFASQPLQAFEALIRQRSPL